MNPRAPLFNPPLGYTRIKIVNSFDELISTRLADGVNGLCWRRELSGDFGEVVRALRLEEEITTLDDADLRDLRLSAAGAIARDALLEDQRLLRSVGLEPILDCIRAYPGDADEDPMSTDVYSFHADSATAEADTFLCSYTEVASEGLRNDEAALRVKTPDMRAKLLELHGGADDESFLAFLKERFFDLHYSPRDGATPFSFGLGNLWRIATEYPGSPVPPFIHRAPTTSVGQAPRLLLIS